MAEAVHAEPLKYIELTSICPVGPFNDQIQMNVLLISDQAGVKRFIVPPWRYRLRPALTRHEDKVPTDTRLLSLIHDPESPRDAINGLKSVKAARHNRLGDGILPVPTFRAKR
jgi:hypothetical protein